MNPTCKPSNGSTKLGESRIQAVLLSLEIGIVVDVRISPRTTGKADAVQKAEGSSPVLSAPGLLALGSVRPKYRAQGQKVQDSVLDTIR